MALQIIIPTRPMDHTTEIGIAHFKIAVTHLQPVLQFINVMHRLEQLKTLALVLHHNFFHH